MIIDIPVDFSCEDREMLEGWLERHSSQLPAIVEINGTLYRIFGVYNANGKLLSVRVAN